MGYEKQNPHTAGWFTAPGTDRQQFKTISLSISISLRRKATVSLITRNVRGEAGRDTRLGMLEFQLPQTGALDPLQVLRAAYELLLIQGVEAEQP